MKRSILLFIAASLTGISLPAQTLTISDSNSSVDKWSTGTKSGVFLYDGETARVANAAATPSNAQEGIFTAKAKGARNGREYRMFIYAPYQETPEFKDGNMKVTVPALQDGDCAPINFGMAAVKGAGKMSASCDMAARTSNIIIKLSSRNQTYKDWNLESIALTTEGGIICGDALLDTKTGKLSPDPDGTCGDKVTFAPGKEMHIGSEYHNIKLKLIPCPGLHGKKFRLDYTFTKDGSKVVICHDVVGMNLYESYTYTLEERIPEVIADRWHMASYPGENWETVAPESMGYSSEKLEALRKTIQEDYTTTSIMVIVGGKVIFSMGDLEEPVRIASCRKSLMSMLYGKYVASGAIDLDATLEDLGIDDKGGLLPSEKKATVRNLLTARSGVYHPAANDGDDTKYAPERGSMAPGTYYLYNNWDFNCLGGIFEKLTGKDIYDAFMEDIAIPVGMQDYKIDNQHKTGITDPTLSNFLAYHFWLSTRDMARIAYLMLNKGSWNGTQVISEDWVKTTTSIFTPRAEMNPASRHKKEFDYGYLWWIFCKDFEGYDESVYGDGYTATGSGGQYMTVLPKLNMVIAHKDKTERTEKSTYYKLIAKIAACRE